MQINFEYENSQMKLNTLPVARFFKFQSRKSLNKFKAERGVGLDVDDTSNPKFFQTGRT